MSQFTDITILLDRSGSMHSCREATVRGINDFIKTVNADPGEGHWTFLQFDDRDNARGAGEEFPHPVFSHLRENEVPLVEEKDFVPRGGTALVDAVCATVHKIREWYLSLPGEKPRVLIVIVTDGHENMSREYTSEQMRELLGEVQAKYDFKLIYLGANQDSFETARSCGMVAPLLKGPAPSWLNELMGGALVAPGATPAINYASTPEGTSEVLMKTSHVTRAWKAEGNDTVSQLVSPEKEGK